MFGEAMVLYFKSCAMSMYPNSAPLYTYTCVVAKRAPSGGVTDGSCRTGSAGSETPDSPGGLTQPSRRAPRKVLRCDAVSQAQRASAVGSLKWLLHARP
eukprot:6603516-Pyramimonas_sp.AAC.3